MRSRGFFSLTKFLHLRQANHWSWNAVLCSCIIIGSDHLGFMGCLVRWISQEKVFHCFRDKSLDFMTCHLSYLQFTGAAAVMALVTRSIIVSYSQLLNFRRRSVPPLRHPSNPHWRCPSLTYFFSLRDLSFANFTMECLTTANKIPITPPIPQNKSCQFPVVPSLPQSPSLNPSKTFIPKQVTNSIPSLILPIRTHLSPI